jgi:hypothetical protein
VPDLTHGVCMCRCGVPEGMFGLGLSGVGIILASKAILTLGEWVQFVTICFINYFWSVWVLFVIRALF